ncbi:MAG: MmcQ/YjbR family DNA-binding protein [Actinomycetia bacterium]|nr:MmcQ/YjbR family DNA-binding protein [Actinomycetes bacterium]
MSAKKTGKTPLSSVRQRCAERPGATLDHTFGPETDLYRVGNKMFALVNTEDLGSATLKASPEEVQALLATYDFARPGYYMNKRHWVTIDLVEGVPIGDVLELVDESYRLVLESLPKKRQAEIGSS